MEIVDTSHHSREAEAVPNELLFLFFSSCKHTSRPQQRQYSLDCFFTCLIARFRVLYFSTAGLLLLLLLLLEWNGWKRRNLRQPILLLRVARAAALSYCSIYSYFVYINNSHSLSQSSGEWIGGEYMGLNLLETETQTELLSSCYYYCCDIYE